jgi:hypothetical protein
MKVLLGSLKVNGASVTDIVDCVQHLLSDKLPASVRHNPAIDPMPHADVCTLLRVHDMLRKNHMGMTAAQNVLRDMGAQCQALAHHSYFYREALYPNHDRFDIWIGGGIFTGTSHEGMHQAAAAAVDELRKAVQPADFTAQHAEDALNLVELKTFLRAARAVTTSDQLTGFMATLPSHIRVEVERCTVIVTYDRLEYPVFRSNVVQAFRQACTNLMSMYRIKAKNL